VLENAALRATISRVARWSITSLIDLRSNNETIAADQAANSFQVYHDDGGLYRFGDEMAGCNLTPDGAAEIPGDLTVLESGPLRARISATLTVDGQTFIKEYLLVVNEPFVRMRSTGAAPAGTSVLARLPLGGSVDDLVYGTAYHWNREPPARAGSLTFEATHDFLIPHFQGSPLAAVFHSGVPAWAAQPDGTLVGALWRNAVQERCDTYGASGTDAEAHTAEYALRVASGIAAPEQGEQLREALAFEIPLQAIVATPAGTLPRSFSLASASPDAALITVAKAGSSDAKTLLLRVAQPTNAPLRVAVRTAVAQRFPPRWHFGVQGRTALETALSPASAARMAVSGSAQQFDFTAARALTTIAVEGNH
jgi:alpha-mannosidase